jgi:Uma2 family endonuclease
VDAVLVAYLGNTPGVDGGDNTTILLGEHGEPQPDAYLRILPEYGGQSGTTEDDYVDGPPELIFEIANSSRAIDLHGKKDDYTLYGVKAHGDARKGTGRDGACRIRPASCRCTKASVIGSRM